MITEIPRPDVLKAGRYCKQISVSAQKGTICKVVLAETGRLFCLGLSSTSRFLLHVRFFINARSFRDGPPFYYIKFGDLKRRSLHRFISALIKRISPVVLDRNITNSILNKSLFCVCVFGG